jgi:hypothetical protein
VGLGLVKTGQPIEDLSKAYPSATIKKSTKYWELNKFHSVFGDVTFYFDDRTKKITHIAFYCEGIASFTNRLVEILGPHTSSPQKDFYHWKTDAKVSVFVGPPSGAAFLIMGEGLEPSWWPKK